MVLMVFVFVVLVLVSLLFLMLRSCLVMVLFSCRSFCVTIHYNYGHIVGMVKHPIIPNLFSALVALAFRSLHSQLDLE